MPETDALWHISLTYAIPGGRIELDYESDKEFAADAIPRALAWGNARVEDHCGAELARLDCISLTA